MPLVLTRDVGEEIILTTPQGDVITVRVTRIQGKQAAIGIDAPPHIKVDRSEVHARKEAGLPPPSGKPVIRLKTPRTDFRSEKEGRRTHR